MDHVHHNGADAVGVDMDKARYLTGRHNVPTVSANSSNACS